MKKAYTIITIISAILLVWLVASYVDVVSDNLCTEPIYKAWNLFEIFFGK